MLNRRELSRHVQQARSEKGYLLRRQQEISTSLDNTRENIQNTKKAQEVVQDLVEAIQNRVHTQIAGIATSCLKSIFGEDSYRLEIQFEKKRGKTEARLVLCQGENEFDALSSCGGGVVDVISFALRVSALILSRPAKRRFLCLDEPFKHLSSEYAEKVRGMLESLSEKLGIQFLIVTHSQDLSCGKVVDITEFV